MSLCQVVWDQNTLEKRERGNYYLAVGVMTFFLLAVTLAPPGGDEAEFLGKNGHTSHMLGVVFLLCVPPGENLAEQSFVTYLARTPTRASGDAPTVRYRALTYANFGYFYPSNLTK